MIAFLHAFISRESMVLIEISSAYAKNLMIKPITESIWLKINNESNLTDRDTQLRLRQKAYSIWIDKYPHEKDDDGCHLEEIYSWLLSGRIN